MTGIPEIQFTYPFSKSCDVKMERAWKTGVTSYTVCLEEFQIPITYPLEPMDIYHDWIDAYEAVINNSNCSGAYWKLNTVS